MPTDVTESSAATDASMVGILGDDIGFLLARASALTTSAGNAALAEHQLRVRSYSALAVIRDRPGIAQRELAEALRLDPSKIVALVSDLEGLGFIARTTSTADRRANVLSITRAGERALVEATSAVRDAELVQHPAITGTDRAELLRLLRLLAFPSD